MEILERICNDLFDVNSLLNLLKNIWMVSKPFLIIYYFIYKISFYFILKKEHKKGWYVLIPIYNFYLLFKIVKLEFVYFFVPVLNAIILFIIPYKLARQYECKEWMWYAAFFIPFVILPYIAFSERKNKELKHEFNYLRFGEDVDKLDNKLKIYDNDNLIENDNEIIVPKTKVQVKQSPYMAFIDDLNYGTNRDEYVEDQEFNEEVKVPEEIITKKEKNDDEFVELEVEDNIINLSEIDALDEQLVDENEKAKEVKTDIKDYEKIGPSVNAIAFGGKDKYENQSEAKVDELKCPRCGSSLIGAKGSCPGCGAKL